MTTNKVLVLIEATPKGGRIIFRALQDWQTVLAERVIELSADDLVFQGETVSADYTKVIAIIKALKHLTTKLSQNTTAPYEVILVQPSLTVQRWLSNPESRKAELAQTFGAYVDRLTQRFPQIRLERRDRPVMDRLMVGGAK